MKANDLLDMIGNADDSIIAEAKKRKRPAIPRWSKWVAVAACLCLVAVGSINTLLRFDYFKAGCSAMPGTIVGNEYYYNVRHSGVWRYSSNSTDRILSAYWEEGWLVNESGLYYKNGNSLYRMDLKTLDKEKIYSSTEGTHIGFDLSDHGNVIVTVYDKNEQYAYQVLIDGKTGGVLEQLTDRVSYSDLEQLYTNQHYRIGERQIVLVPIADVTDDKYMPTENGNALLPEGSWVGSYSYDICDEVLYFGVCNGSDAKEESETLIIFADGYTILRPQDFRYSGAIGHILLYVDNENPENYGSNGAGIWCYDSDSEERWQLKIDADCEFYEFVNNDMTLYSCVPWNHDQTAWKIVYEGNRPVSLQLIDNNITE